MPVEVTFASTHAFLLLTLVVLQEHAYALPAPWPLIVDALVDLAEEPGWLSRRGVIGGAVKVGSDLVKPKKDPPKPPPPGPTPPKSAPPKSAPTQSATSNKDSPLGSKTASAKPSASNSKDGSSNASGAGGLPKHKVGSMAGGIVGGLALLGGIGLLLWWKPWKTSKEEEGDQ